MTRSFRARSGHPLDDHPLVAVIEACCAEMVTAPAQTAPAPKSFGEQAKREGRDSPPGPV